jgi:pimeloyl-ACP methyl ester carboxylesterase
VITVDAITPAGLGELRAVPEFAAFVASAPLLSQVRRGDGHPVLVLPGLGGSDRSTEPVRWLLRQLRYRVHGWSLGTNEGASDRIRTGLMRRLESLSARYGERLSLVGWSMGGVQARLLAHATPHSIRQVITLGSPIRAGGGDDLPVPSTSIYSRSDAIVDYRLSQGPPGPRREYVEVRGSHLGLGHNPAVLLVVADRLAQPVGEWKPFRPPAALRFLFPPGAAPPARPVRP